MTIALFGHPFSSYTWKALIALYENATPFEFRILEADHPENGVELARCWPLVNSRCLSMVIASSPEKVGGVMTNRIEEWQCPKPRRVEFDGLERGKVSCVFAAHSAGSQAKSGLN
jgi:hypothetical protein